MRDEEITLKVCVDCNEAKSLTAFCKDSGYKDGRRGDCNACRQIQRRGAGKADVAVYRVPTMDPVPAPYVHTVQARDLPNPSRLPAAYLKNCSDYWTELVGGSEPAMRIA